MSYAAQYLILNTEGSLYFDFLSGKRVIVLFAIVVFWLLIFLLFYTYVGYPVLVSFLGKICNNTVNKKQIQPSVSFIIAAHNEEACIREKIENTLQLHYPRDKLEIIVASDSSTDDTNSIVKEFRNKGIILCEQQERLGKTSAQIAAIRMSQGKILVFSDASTSYDKDAISVIVLNFSDQSVGCAGGRVIFVDDAKPDTTERKVKQNVVTDMEHTIREGESRIYGTPGVSGCIYAVRKSCYKDIDPRIADDFGVPLDLLMRGNRVVFEPDAVAYEEMKKHGIDLKRNVRTINQGWVALQLLNLKVLLFKNPTRFSYILFILFGHKLLRWVSFIFLFLLFAANTCLILKTGTPFYVITMLLQIIFYSMALAGFLYPIQNRFLSIPYRFCLYHYAALIAFVKYCRGEKIVVWN